MNYLELFYTVSFDLIGSNGIAPENQIIKKEYVVYFVVRIQSQMGVAKTVILIKE
ncbi:hypothetical protein [endosymbiont 'TC1' of Trimyema compressum]|uniref:hypothetical protein n=1 Tax=endosymbiont 'TC1' of Trimyema compressum TaxID=243899 RepID=UPI001392213B|nr:hypothetical protein [endosymbiont 'TC1' of Trimyema compressum]